MIIQGLALAHQERGVQVHVLREARVPLRTALRDIGQPIEEVHLGSFGRPDPENDECPSVATFPMRIQGLRPQDWGRPGLIAARGEYDAAAFLLDRFEPRGAGDVDSLIREARARKGSKPARIEWLLARMVEYDHDDDDPFFVARRRRSRRVRARYLWRIEDFARAFRRVQRSAPAIVLPDEPHPFREPETPTAWIVVEQSRTLGRHRVPRWEVLLRYQTSDQEPMVQGHWNEQWFEASLGHLDARVEEVFDRGGRMVRVSGGDLLFGDLLEPRFVVRVPGRAARRAATAAQVLPEPARGLPAAFLRDSRCPQNLRDDLPVVDDADAAWAVLMRTTSGVFLPDATPRDPPDALRRIAGSYLVASVPDLGPARRSP